ncbi:hypothetical protein E2C01_015500 [Portunus trituberculatus]|uniref:Uncharacterized protein n=1 Tax=Portunus trituberculatus TaxID=210409 RepID=A0A5B7DN84_PORTR|nr:hypothetical protein [Portunus trituberculatus]
MQTIDTESAIDRDICTATGGPTSLGVFFRGSVPTVLLSLKKGEEEEEGEGPYRLKRAGRAWLVGRDGAGRWLTVGWAVAAAGETEARGCLLSRHKKRDADKLYSSVLLPWRGARGSL